MGLINFWFEAKRLQVSRLLIQKLGWLGSYTESFQALRLYFLYIYSTETFRQDIMIISIVHA